MYYQIKNRLKVVRNPRDSYKHTFQERLRDVHGFLIFIKTEYPVKFDLAKLTLTARNGSNFPNWFFEIAQLLQLYLDVVIVKKRVIPKNRIEPVMGYEIYGIKDSVLLAAHYLDYIFTAIELLVESKTSNHKRKAKQVRRRNRRGGTDPELLDTRVYSRIFRNQLVNSTKYTINRLLADLSNNHNDAFMKGLATQEKIDKYLEKWKTA